MRINLWDHFEGTSPEPFIETFLHKGAANPLGGVLVVPGGAYSHLGSYEGNAVAETFNDLGLHAFVLNYRVLPNRHPAPQQDFVRAMAIIRSHAQKWRLGKLAALGFSAGAHLVTSGTMLQSHYESPEISREPFAPADAMILCYPAVSLTDDFANMRCGDNLFGDVPTETKAALNMQNWITKDTPPTFLWHTADDDTVNVRNSMIFAEKMWACGNSCELHVFPHGFHGRGLGFGTKDLRQWPALAATFLDATCGFVKANP